MKKATLILSIITVTFLMSCSSDNNNSEPNNTNKLVKSEYVTNNYNLKYMYNENHLLKEIVNFQLHRDVDLQTNYTYNEDDNIINKNIENNILNYNRTTNYSYDINNKLVSATEINYANGSNSTQDFSYSNNIITVNMTSGGGGTFVVFLETNSSGLINKMSKSDYYTSLIYDSNGNISEVTTFDYNDNLLYKTKYSYDNKQNPFYGQLKSIYLPTFLKTFQNVYLGDFVSGGFNGYNFPFFKNNIISIIHSENLDLNYNYVYDNEDYPINVIEEYNGNNSIEFAIVYE